MASTNNHCSERLKNTPEAEKQRLLVVMNSPAPRLLAHRRLNPFVGHFARRAFTSRKVAATRGNDPSVLYLRYKYCTTRVPVILRYGYRRTLILPVTPRYFQRNRIAITNVLENRTIQPGFVNFLRYR